MSARERERERALARVHACAREREILKDNEEERDRPMKAKWLGVATISRRLKIKGIFCKRALLKRRYSAKETYNFKEPTNRNHPIGGRERQTTESKVARTQKDSRWS